MVVIVVAFLLFVGTLAGTLSLLGGIAAFLMSEFLVKQEIMKATMVFTVRVGVVSLASLLVGGLLEGLLLLVQ